LFADITRSSALLNKIRTGEVIDLLNEYFDRLGSIALRYGGTIDKFLGDGLMVRFNIPRRIANYEVAAVKAGLAMQAEFEQIRLEWQRLGRPVEGLGNRIGLASGPVNVAAHLCEASRQTEAGILVCKTTFERAERELISQARFVPLKGNFEEPVYEVQPIAGRRD